MSVKRVLVCAPNMPEFDREGGSQRIFHMLQFLRQDGWAVSFLGLNATDNERYTQLLQQMGIVTYAGQPSKWVGDEYLPDPTQLIAKGQFDLAIIAFWFIAESLLPVFRNLSPQTRLVVDSVDLHLLRNARKKFRKIEDNQNITELDGHYANEMMRELNVYAAADAVLTVSQTEADLINNFLAAPVEKALVVPDTEDQPFSPFPFDERKGLVLIGNFRHPPNVEAVEYLCKQILPKVPEAIMQEYPVYIVGNALGEEVRKFGANLNNVVMVGWVPSVLPYLQRARVSLIPLLHGAGTKRKLIQALMTGTPSVSTSIGVEGLDLEHEKHVLIADNPTNFASEIVRLVTTKNLWQDLVDQGRTHITRVHSQAAIYLRFKQVLDEILAQPV